MKEERMIRERTAKFLSPLFKLIELRKYTGFKIIKNAIRFLDV